VVGDVNVGNNDGTGNLNVVGGTLTVGYGLQVGVNNNGGGGAAREPSPRPAEP